MSFFVLYIFKIDATVDHVISSGHFFLGWKFHGMENWCV